MELCLREFETFPAHVCLEADPSVFRVEYEGVCGVKSARIDLVIQHSGDEYFCQGDVSAVVTMECVRCLTQCDKQVETKIDFVVCYESVHNEFRKEAADDEDYVYCQGVQMMANIDDQVRQAIILVLPSMPLCTDDCRGLCPICGVNCNIQSCDCSKEESDGRWEGLSDLRNT